MTAAMEQEFITLIPNQGKYPSTNDKWRSITLLNICHQLVFSKRFLKLELEEQLCNNSYTEGAVQQTKKKKILLKLLFSLGKLASLQILY